METSTGKITPFGLRLPADLKTWVADQAKKERRSVNSWLTLLVEQKRAAGNAKQA